MGLMRTKKDMEAEARRLYSYLIKLDPTDWEYNEVFDKYMELLNAIDAMTPPKKSLWEKFIDVAKIVLGVLASVVVPVTMAKVSYMNDEELKRCNGRIWNLAKTNVKTEFDKTMTKTKDRIFRSKNGR